MSIACQIVSTLAPSVIQKISEQTAHAHADPFVKLRDTRHSWRHTVVDAFFSGQSELYFEIAVIVVLPPDGRAVGGQLIHGILERSHEQWRLRVYRFASADASAVQ